MDRVFRMRGSFIASVWGTLVLGGAAAAWAAPPPAEVTASPLAQDAVALDGLVNEGLGLSASTVVSLNVDPAPGQPLMVTVPIDGSLYTLDLVPRSVRSENFRVLAQVDDGSLVEVDVGPERTYRGTVAEWPGSVVAASVFDDGLHARILLPEGEEYWVEPIAARVDGAGRDQHAAYRKSDTVCRGTCGNNDKEIRHRPVGVGQPIDSGGVASFVALVTELAADADFEYYVAHGSNSTNVVNRITFVTNAGNPEYEADVNITHQVGTIIVRTSSSDPYTLTSSSGRLGQFRTEWNTNQTGVARDVAELFTGIDLDGTTVGQAFDIGGLCMIQDSYCIVQSDCCGSDACATTLSQHELGHLWNGTHCSCPNTIMYTPLACSAAGFAAVSQTEIETYANCAACLGGAGPAPSNDLCAGSPAIGTGTVSGTTCLANQEGSDTCDSYSPDVFYRYTPASNGTLTVHTCDGPFVYDTVLSVHTGCPGSGSQIVCNDDSAACGTGDEGRQSQVQLSVTAGVTYHIRVSGWNSDRGAFTLNLSQGGACGGRGAPCSAGTDCCSGVCKRNATCR